jgi:hypothetical protein
MACMDYDKGVHLMLIIKSSGMPYDEMVKNYADEKKREQRIQRVIIGVIVIAAVGILGAIAYTGYVDNFLPHKTYNDLSDSTVNNESSSANIVFIPHSAQQYYVYECGKVRAMARNSTETKKECLNSIGKNLT